MKTSERAWRIGSDVAGVLPRAHAALRSEGWNPLSPRGLRLLGEVVMDEAALTEIRGRRFGRTMYERLTFEHDPKLPGTLTEFGGPASAAVHLCRRGDDRW